MFFLSLYKKLHLVFNDIKHSFLFENICSKMKLKVSFRKVESRKIYLYKY